MKILSVYGTPMPPLRLGNRVVFAGGGSRALTLRERFRLWRGKEVNG